MRTCFGCLYHDLLTCGAITRGLGMRLPVASTRPRPPSNASCGESLEKITAQCRHPPRWSLAVVPGHRLGERRGGFKPMIRMPASLRLCFVSKRELAGDTTSTDPRLTAHPEFVGAAM